MSLPLQLYSRLPILEIFSDHSSEFKGPRTEKCGLVILCDQL
jgi:hypothetical protein